MNSADVCSATHPRPRSLLRSAAVAVLAMVAGLVSTVSGAGSAHADAIGPVQVIVSIDPARTSIAAVNLAHHTTLVSASSGLADTYLLNGPAGQEAELLADQIAADPGVVWATANATLTPPEVDADRMYAWRMYAWTEGTALPAESAYAPAAVNLTAAHALASGAGVTVAIVDTGVAPHAVLAGSLVGGIDIVDGDSDASETQNGLDDDDDGQFDEGAGHGTHVAGVVHQVAPGAKIMPVRVLDDDGSGSMWSTAEGILWANRHGARVINASLGTHSSASLLKDVVAMVIASGSLVVGAAGNDGKDRPMYPGAADGALAVAAVGKGDVASSFTNFGRWVDVAAPGEDIHSTFAFPAGSYAANSGTSMATPFVSGEAALVWSRAMSASPGQVANLIRSTAARIDRANPAYAGLLGSGRIDAGAATAAAG